MAMDGSSGKGKEREAFEAWMTFEDKCIVGSADPYPAGIEKRSWRVWRAAWKACAASSAATVSDAASAWQPIETAQKFGDPIDIWGRYGRSTDCVYGKPTYTGGLHWIHQCDYDSNGPVFEIVVDPTHWMPPPSAPAQSNNGG